MGASSVSPSARFFSASEKLVTLLGREYSEEIQNETNKMPAELIKLQSDLEKEWKIVDDGASTRMFRTAGPTKIQVSFHCQDSVESDDYPYSDNEEFEGEEGNENAEATGEDNDSLEPSVPVRFSVTATKAGKSLVLVCLSEDASPRIHSVSISTQDVEVIHQTGIGATQYQGPEFGELAEDLQEAFQNFLGQDVGISQEVASFVAMMADYKEQAQYTQFLDDAKAILSK
jgi:complement component 1 Q subcomponent-binding protein